MSGKREKLSSATSSSPNVPDAKLTDVDKLFGDTIEESVDSGFLSGGNLIYSGEIQSEEAKVEPDSGPAVGKSVEEEYMRLDSGVDLCLSENFSGLSLENPNLNNLSCSKLKPELKPIKPTPRVESTKQNQDELLWRQYFQQDEDGDTCLHIAIVQGFIEIVLALIRIAPHPLLLDTPNDEAQSPIHLAALTGQPRIVRWLIAAGAKPSPRNINGDSPLHIAARNGNLQCCKAITDPIQEQEKEALALSYSHQPHHRLDLDQWNYEGQTCVHVAAINGHIDVLRHLVWYGADINAREGRCGYTALHYSIERADERLAHFLLTECKKLNVEVVTYGGCSPLDLGSQVSQTLIQFLKSRGVSSPLSSEEEFSESEDEVAYENANIYLPNLVNASA